MSISNDSNKKIEVQFVQNVDHQQVLRSSSSGAEILRQWKREDFLKRGMLWLRVMTFIFSLISIILVSSNKYGNWKKLYKYKEYGYFLAIAIISVFYSGYQVFRQVHELCIGINRLHLRPTALLDSDFVGDQVVAYLLISSVSSAIPITNRLRGASDSISIDYSAAAISVSFFAFLCLALSAILSGYKISATACI